jgi:Lysine methyltransferase
MESQEPKNVAAEDDDYFADVGFMFEAQQPVRYERFDWDTSDFLDTTEREDDAKKQRITVALHVADDIPGAVQSGHYLWPAAILLSKYLIRQYSNRQPPSLSSPQPDPRTSVPPLVRTVLELGAGCGLASLTALQLWQETLQCLCLTDHDRGTLVRARDNLETTVQLLVVETNDDDDDDEQLNAAINGIASIPVLFEMLEWGDTQRAVTLLQSVIPERLPSCILSSDSEHASHSQTEACTSIDDSKHKESSTIHIDVVLGSDLIYCTDVVQPLFGTAAHMMGATGRFILAQSFAYDDATEQEIDYVCERYSLQRDIIIDFDDISLGKGRVQEFYFVGKPSTSMV